jgi:hypothetical protein
MELTWCLAKLALELKSDCGIRASSDIAHAMEAALKKAERYSRQTPQNGLALTNLNSLKHAIAGMRLDGHPRTAGTSQGRLGIAQQVTR